MNLALIGEKGTGKSSISKSVAKAMNRVCVVVNLNGIRDISYLTGCSDFYKDSTPGIILRAIKKAGGTGKLVILLDEIDKMPRELSYVLIDILDRHFTDNFLGVPVDLTNVIFIATANNWDNVDPILKDRFKCVYVEGYSKREKLHILDEYVIPKMEESYVAKGNLSISMDDEAKDILLENYCASFSARDVEKNMQTIVAKMLNDDYSETGQDSDRLNIKAKDVFKILGRQQVSSGNFPAGGKAIPGVAKALAVSGGNTGKCFAIETVLIPFESDREENLHITGLPKESTVDSCKIAHVFLKRNYPELMKRKDVYIHFAEGAVPKDGPSAGVAIVMSILSAAKGAPIMVEKANDCAFTGEISLAAGGVFAIGGVKEKIQAAYSSGCRKVFIPTENYVQLTDEELKEYDMEIIPVNYVSEVIEEVFADFCA